MYSFSSGSPRLSLLSCQERHVPSNFLPSCSHVLSSKSNLGALCLFEFSSVFHSQPAWSCTRHVHAYVFYDFCSALRGNLVCSFMPSSQRHTFIILSHSDIGSMFSNGLPSRFQLKTFSLPSGSQRLRMIFCQERHVPSNLQLSRSHMLSSNSNLGAWGLFELSSVLPLSAGMVLHKTAPCVCI